MIGTHRRLLLPQAVDPDKIVEALKLLQNISKRNYDKPRQGFASSLCEFVQTEGKNDAKQKCCQGHTSWKMTKDVFTEEIGDRSSQLQMISPCTQRLRDPVVPTIHDSPWSPHLPETDQPASTEAEVPIKFTTGAHRSTITTRSGRQVKKPERLIDSCLRADVVMLLTRDPMEIWFPDCFTWAPRRLFWLPCLSSVREHMLDSFHFVSFLRIFKVKV